jgi:hypothetical protein
MLKVQFASVILAIAFLSAGAGVNRASQIDARSQASENHTIIAKNQAWPLKGLMTVEPCSYSRCVNI